MEEKKKRKRASKATAAKKERFPEPHDYLTDFSVSHGHAAKEGAPQSLGRRISVIREQRKLSLEDLASRTGMDVDVLRRVERNEYTPPLGELIRLGKALEMKMGYFISPSAPKPYTIVRAHGRPTVARYASGSRAHHGYVYESLAPEKADRAMEPFIVTMRPSDEQEMSTHDGQEFIYILEGRMEARLGELVEILEPGDAIYYDSTRPHLVKCHGDQPTRILAVLHTGSK
jgi:quercetin dioxygenase-like cupin family protein/DNA-binding transcriptional regulator YiaG